MLLSPHWPAIDHLDWSDPVYKTASVFDHADRAEGVLLNSTKSAQRYLVDQVKSPTMTRPGLVLYV